MGVCFAEIASCQQIGQTGQREITFWYKLIGGNNSSGRRRSAIVC